MSVAWGSIEDQHAFVQWVVIVVACVLLVLWVCNW